MMDRVSNWMHVDQFTVDQAAALWCGSPPAKNFLSEINNSTEFHAIKQMLTAAIASNLLASDTRLNYFASTGDHSKTLVWRSDLELFARGKNLFPAFLFDTLVSFEDPRPFLPLAQFSKPIAAAVKSEVPAPIPAAGTLKRGGRPQEYDWDTFTLEIIRIAATPDGLPDTQAELVRMMAEWFQRTNGQEPAESSMKMRISRIYSYLEKAKNPST